MSSTNQVAPWPGDNSAQSHWRCSSELANATAPPVLPRRPGRRRDRRGRGLRGPLLAPSLPAARSRLEIFDDHVRAGLARLGQNWARQLGAIEVAVEEVPTSAGAPWEDGVVLGRAFPPAHGLPGRIVLYRRPIEARANSDELGVAVLDVLVEELAHLLHRQPKEIDPGYER